MKQYIYLNVKDNELAQNPAVKKWIAECEKSINDGLSDTDFIIPDSVLASYGFSVEYETNN